jgi:hypothetical protein
MKSTLIVVALCSLSIVPAMAPAAPAAGSHVPGLGEILHSLLANLAHVTSPASPSRDAATKAAPGKAQSHRRLVAGCPAGSTLDPNGGCHG